MFYLINEFFIEKNKNNSIKYIIILILLVDILILGFYFGGSKIIERFYFLSNEFAEIYSDGKDLSRIDIAHFSFIQLKNYLFFGYGSGSFQILFQTHFTELNSQYANHAHSDIVEFIGEFGLIGSGFIFISLINFFKNKNTYSFNNIIIIFCMIIILLFDFSLHVPLIQVMFIIFLAINQKKI